MLTQVRSRDSARLDGDDSKRRRSFGRKNSGSSLTIPAAALFGEVGWGGMSSKSRRSSMSTGTAGAARGDGAISEGAGVAVNVELDSQPAAASQAGEYPSARVELEDDRQPPTGLADEGLEGDACSNLDLEHAAREDDEDDDAILRAESDTRLDLAYPVMVHPQPADSHRHYPNITPFDPSSDEDGSDDVLSDRAMVDAYTAALAGPRVAESRLVDRRQLYDEIEDDYAGYLFSASEADHVQAAHLQVEHGTEEAEKDEQRRYVEWHHAAGRKRWVGPML